MNYPFISCKCITYGRTNLLEESLHSFLIQEYPGKKEMVIVNDYPKQKIHYNHPEVKIFNLGETFETIGEKENFTISNCSGELIAVWDDDDVALSNHLLNISKYFKPKTDLLQWNRGVFYNEPNITDITGLGNSGIVYTKEIWEKLGKHALENAGYDMTFVMNIKNNGGKVVYASPPDNEVSWFYMWGGRGYHMSGMGTDTPDRKNVVERHKEHIERLRQQGKIPEGNVELKPKWNRNYQELLLNFIKNRKNGN